MVKNDDDKYSKEWKVRALVDELNSISEEIYEENGKRFLIFDTAYHFYFEKNFENKYKQYYILRDTKDRNGETECVAGFGDVRNKVFDGFTDISEQQQHLIMSFILSLEDGDSK